MSPGYAKVMDYPDEMKVFDLSNGYDEQYIRSFDWGIGKYNEKRQNMYVTPQFGSSAAGANTSEGRRDIHMAVDIWTAAGSPVYAFADGTIAYAGNNNQPGDYGPTIITKHSVDGEPLFALHGHLSAESLNGTEAGQPVNKGEKIAAIGSKNVNGGWAPHLHFQLSTEDPGEADMPGVVSEARHEQALNDFPDPRIVLGALY